jgi:hypothetical protein
MSGYAHFNDCCGMYRSNGVILMHSFTGESGVLSWFFAIFSCDLVHKGCLGLLL